MAEKEDKMNWVRLLKGDITALDVEAIVYYARTDLKLGTGMGGAIAVRGGPAVQEQLNGTGPLEVGQVITTSGGKLKAKHILHAVGPRFHEQNEEVKLRKTMESTLDQIKAQGIKQVAFPAMGSGFYGISLDLCSRVMLETIREKQNGSEEPIDAIICLNDNRDYDFFSKSLASLNK